MLDYLIEENDLYPVLKQYGIGSEELTLVKDYILGAKVIIYLFIFMNCLSDYNNCINALKFQNYLN